jgi:hypothetical protein
MSSQLFLILIIIFVLLMIHRTSSNIPLSTPSKSTAIPIDLPNLESLLKNVLSNTTSQLQ